MVETSIAAAENVVERIQTVLLLLLAQVLPPPTPGWEQQALVAQGIDAFVGAEEEAVPLLNRDLETGFGGVEEKRAIETAEGDVVELEEVGLGEFKGGGELQRELPNTVEKEEEGGGLG